MSVYFQLPPRPQHQPANESITPTKAGTVSAGYPTQPQGYPAAPPPGPSGYAAPPPLYAPAAPGPAMPQPGIGFSGYGKYIHIVIIVT